MVDDDDESEFWTAPEPQMRVPGAMKDDTPSPKVVSLVRENVNDIPQMLENVARAMRAGKYGTITAGVTVFLDGNGAPIVMGWGRADDVQSIGLLHIGATWLASHRVERKV